jgi:hypothetical protein
VPTTEPNGSARPRPHNATTPPASGVWSTGHAQRDDATATINVAQRKRTAETTQRHDTICIGGGGGVVEATRSETTPRHPNATDVDKGLHSTKTHQRVPPFATQPPMPIKLQQTLEPGNKQRATTTTTATAIAANCRTMELPGTRAGHRPRCHRKLDKVAQHPATTAPHVGQHITAMAAIA